MKNLVFTFLSTMLFLLPTISIAQLCFSSATNYTVGTSPQCIISEDLNNDGYKDIVTANFYSDNISILLGNGLGGASTYTTISVGDVPMSVYSSDFNVDGKKDLAVAIKGQDNVVILIGNGLGGFSSPIWKLVGGAPYCVLGADFNADGKIDIITSNQSSNNISILLGIGNGTFSNTVNYSVGSSPYYMTIADYNADGKKDIATANYASNNVSILLGTGTGSFAPAVNYTVSSFPWAITSGDFNGDGKIDIATANRGSSNNVSLLFNNGAGVFSAATNFSLTAGSYPLSIINIDINNDGKKDLVTAMATNNVAIFIGNGTGSFSAANNFAVGTGPTSVIGADFNGDGKIDLATSNSNINPGVSPDDVSILLSLFTMTTSSTKVSCPGGTNGTASVSVTCGSPPYTYSWSTVPVKTTATATGLSLGIYTVTVKDASNATKSVTVSVTENSTFTTSISSIPNTKCSGTSNGSATTIPTNGILPYTYLWSTNANSQTSATASNLSAGVYSVTVTDNAGCIVKKQVTVSQNSNVNSNIYLTNLAAVDQINVSPSFAAYYSYNLPSSITPPLSNPRNFVDPGKKARFKVECTNQKSTGLSIVSGICKVRSNSQYITITDSSSALNNVGWNGTKWSADEFEIDINSNTPTGTNAYIDFVVQENGQDFNTTCIAIPITPLVYAPTTLATIDDDNNPDSQGNNDEICNPGETIEFYPWLDNVSKLNAEYVRGKFENLDNHSFINIWNGVPGVNTTVYDATWWNYFMAQPQIVNSGSTNTTPEYDFVFDYNNSSIVNNFKLYLVMAGGFKLFSTNALSLVQWTLPYTFNSNGAISVKELEATSLNINVTPNPTSGIFQIETTLKDAGIKIFNLQGQIIFESTKFISEINLSNSAKGIYFLQLKTENKIISKKIIIQ